MSNGMALHTVKTGVNSSKAGFGLPIAASNFSGNAFSFLNSAYKQSLPTVMQKMSVDVMAKRRKFDTASIDISVDIKEFIQWVKIIAQKIHRTLPSSVMLDDLVQDGMVGLIKAIREHNADSDIPFYAYASNKIKWAIMDGLRADDWADKHVRRRANKVAKTTERLQALLYRQPSKKEIADELGVSVDDITTILGDVYSYNFVRIDEGFHEGTQDDGVQTESQDIPDLRMEPSAIVERDEIYSRIIACLQTLQPNERKVVVLRIMCDMSGQQAATEMDLSESRISQLYKTATEKLANHVYA